MKRGLALLIVVSNAPLLSCRESREGSAETSPMPALGQPVKPATKITVVEHDRQPPPAGARVVVASRGFPTAGGMSRGLGFTDKSGRVAFDGLPPEECIFVGNPEWPNATVFAAILPVAAQAPVFRLRPPPHDQAKVPSLDLHLERLGKDEATAIRITMRSESAAAYVLHQTDLRVSTSRGAIVLPPGSQQHVGLRVPEKGLKGASVLLNWSDYVERGIWHDSVTASDEPWPAQLPDSTELYVRVWVGRSGSHAVAVPKPETMLALIAAQ